MEYEIKQDYNCSSHQSTSTLYVKNLK